ncbi:hypothetical protein AB1Y20_013061 [Prymnesium parvum]|uniref:Peptide-methionine (R)-S-oxide reductase n=1 Tax=Prymnesium parvum TaxID=97485 RepID=A0AB34IJK5_PRYPA
MIQRARSLLGSSRTSISKPSADEADAPADDAPSSPAVVFGFRKGQKGPVYGDESLMRPRAHGTSDTPVQPTLRWGCDVKQADKICNFNRHYAERARYFMSTSFMRDLHRAEREGEKTLTFFDSNTGQPLFSAPRFRSYEKFWAESKAHGWPSFRDEEVNWDRVRLLANRECVSIDGTHLGHNLPDRYGNRYCINLVSVAGFPK